MKSRRFHLAWLAMIVIPAALTYAGGSGVGNGGGIWTCRAKSGNHPLLAAELVDLSEARREFALEFPRDKTRNIKQAMMLELLAYKTRLI